MNNNFTNLPYLLNSKAHYYNNMYNKYKPYLNTLLDSFIIQDDINKKKYEPDEEDKKVTNNNKIIYNIVDDKQTNNNKTYCNIFCYILIALIIFYIIKK